MRGLPPLVAMALLGGVPAMEGEPHHHKPHPLQVLLAANRGLKECKGLFKIKNDQVADNLAEKVARSPRLPASVVRHLLLLDDPNQVLDALMDYYTYGVQRTKEEDEALVESIVEEARAEVRSKFAYEKAVAAKKEIEAIERAAKKENREKMHEKHKKRAKAHKKTRRR